MDLVKMDGREFYLVGTAHVSKASADLAEEIIREIQPDSVAVELCEPRYRSLKDPDRWKNTDIVSVIRSGKAYLLIAQLMLSSFQKKIGAQLGTKPGEEMLRAVDVAEELGIETVMADREVRVTLSRTWSRIGFFTKMKVMFSLMTGMFIQEEVDAEEIERLKSSDVLEEVMGEFSRQLPEVRTALIDERDLYLATRIRQAPGQRVVAIVGAGHVPGIIEALDMEVDLGALETTPPPSPWGRVIGWAIPLIILAMIAYGFFNSGAETSLKMAMDWFWINSVAGGLGALLALAHPLTILVAFLVSPFTSLNPTIAAGWVAGLVEAGLRKPRVADFEDVAEDVTTFRGLWRNRLSHILMVIVLTNLFGTVGTFLGGTVLASQL